MEQNKIYEKLAQVQAELKAPKSQFNAFGKYSYRSQEDILEAVKPLLARFGMTVTLSDEVHVIGDRFYIRATASVSDGTDRIEVTAYAREPNEKKGMDESQITGSASSYARKYALNGLFAIDDTKDSDSAPAPATGPKKASTAPQIEKREETPTAPTAPSLSASLISQAKALSIDLTKVATYLKKKPEELTDEDLSACIERKKKAVKGGAR